MPNLGRLFVKGDRKPPGSGRKKGSKNKVPPSLKAVVDYYGADPAGLALFHHALARGLKAAPPHSAPYMRLLADRVLGPIPKIPHDPSRQPLVIVLGQPLGSYDPLAHREASLPAPIIVEMPREPAPRPAASAKALPAGQTPGPDSDLELVP